MYLPEIIYENIPRISLVSGLLGILTLHGALPLLVELVLIWYGVHIITLRRFYRLRYSTQRR